jgi:hypothetical protein
LLDALFGAVVHWCGGDSKGERIPQLARDLQAQGRKPFVLPYEASNPLGAMGFVATMGELKEQMETSSASASNGRSGDPPYVAAGQLGLEQRYTPGCFSVCYDLASPGYELVSGLEREAIRLVSLHGHDFNGQTLRLGIHVEDFFLPANAGRLMLQFRDGQLVNLEKDPPASPRCVPGTGHQGGRPFLAASGSRFPGSAGDPGKSLIFRRGGAFAANGLR